jgi:hypothetical protein
MWSGIRSWPAPISNSGSALPRTCHRSSSGRRTAPRHHPADHRRGPGGLVLHHQGR